MAFQVENQSCPNREESFVSNNNNNNSNNSKYNTTTANHSKNNILSNTIGIPNRGNTYQDPGAQQELPTATSTRVNKRSIYKHDTVGESGNWKHIENDSDYNSQSETESEFKYHSNNKRGSEGTATSKEAIIGQNKYVSGALFTASASEKEFSEKEPSAVPRGDPELYQSKLFKYIGSLLGGNPYEENINYDDGYSVDECRSINDGHEWSSAPICYSS